MKQYKYKAVDLRKTKYNGIFIAKDEDDLAVKLAEQGLYLVSAQIYSGKTPSAFFTLGTGKVKLSELTTFCRQFSIMLNSGISVLSTLEILKEQSFSGYFRQLLQVIYEDVKSGIMLSDALNKHKSVFPAFFRNMIRVGESSSKLDLVFNSLADYYEKDSAIKKKTKSAMAYPIMLMIMAVAVVAIMLTLVVPKFRDALSKMDVEPEGITKIVYDVSDFVKENGLYILSATMVLAIILFFALKTKKGRYAWDWFLVRFPLTATVQNNMIASRFARGFGLLLSSGMDINEAMDAVTIVFGNKDVEARFMMAADDVRHGMNVAMAFEKYKLFPQILIQMVAVGEKTAALDDVLSRACPFFDEAVDSALQSLTSKIQPVMLIIIGSIVAVLFVAVYSPMLSIMNGLI